MGNICSRYAAWSSCGPHTTGAGLSQNLLPERGINQPGLLHLASVGEVVPSFTETRAMLGETWRGTAILLDWVTTDSCLCLLLAWTAGTLTRKSWITPKELLLNRSTIPFPINLSLQPLVDRLEGGLKCLRTLNKVGLEESKPTGYWRKGMPCAKEWN